MKKNDNNDKKKNNEDEIINSIIIQLQSLGEDLMKDKDLNIDIKSDKMDVLLDTMHFLQDYDENVKVLNDYWVNKKHREKFESTLDSEVK